MGNKLLGSSKVSSNYRVSIVKDAVDHMKLEVGDHILFYADEDGQVIIRKG
ncbi:MAG: AbrB/MazE/SpoVT family DNA-binding domain-containing protein [Methanomassiliicoccales archaeon]